MIQSISCLGASSRFFMQSYSGISWYPCSYHDWILSPYHSITLKQESSNKIVSSFISSSSNSTASGSRLSRWYLSRAGWIIVTQFSTLSRFKMKARQKDSSRLLPNRLTKLLLLRWQINCGKVRMGYGSENEVISFFTYCAKQDAHFTSAVSSHCRMFFCSSIRALCTQYLDRYMMAASWSKPSAISVTIELQFLSKEVILVIRLPSSSLKTVLIWMWQFDSLASAFLVQYKKVIVLSGSMLPSDQECVRPFPMLLSDTNGFILFRGWQCPSAPLSTTYFDTKTEITPSVTQQRPGKSGLGLEDGNILRKDSLKIRSENYQCITMKPPEPARSSLISASPGSSRVKANRSRMIFLFTTFLQRESQNFLAVAKCLIFYPLLSSRALLIISFRLSPMTVPGPTVQGPPKVMTILGTTGANQAKAKETLKA